MEDTKNSLEIPHDIIFIYCLGTFLAEAVSGLGFRYFRFTFMGFIHSFEYLDHLFTFSQVLMKSNRVKKRKWPRNKSIHVP